MENNSKQQTKNSRIKLKIRNADVNKKIRWIPLGTWVLYPKICPINLSHN